MVIDRSVTIRPGTYQLHAAADLSTPAITIRGSNITVDFNGVELGGGPEPPTPIRSRASPSSWTAARTSRSRTRVRGYKVGVLARNARAPHHRQRLSYNWKPRLYSLVEHESLLDWMSYHQNDKDEWLRCGAGIYLADSTGAEIDHTTIVQGQNGLMLTRSDGAKIWNNNFSFLSGLGIGLYRASEQHDHAQQGRLVRARLQPQVLQPRPGLRRHPDVRAEPASNIVAFNSVTHGGDGLFLWAGQSTMDTGQGGANDNVFYDNDFSLAPTNGIEATFSRNVFYGNRVEGLLARRLGRLQLRLVDRGQHVRAKHRGHRDRARPGQPHHREPVRRRRDRDPALEERDAGSRTGATRSTATRAAATTSSRATPSSATRPRCKIAETQNVRVLTQHVREGRHRRGADRRHAELRHRRRSHRADSGRGRHST